MTVKVLDRFLHDLIYLHPGHLLLRYWWLWIIIFIAAVQFIDYLRKR